MQGNLPNYYSIDYEQLLTFLLIIYVLVSHAPVSKFKGPSLWFLGSTVIWKYESP